MNTFNVSRFARSVGYFAAVTAVLLSASATQADSPHRFQPSNRIQPPSAIHPTGRALPPSAYRPAGLASANQHKPMTAPPQAPPRDFVQKLPNEVRQEILNGTYGDGCFGHYIPPKPIVERPQWIVKPPQDLVGLPRPRLDTNSTHRPVPNRIPMH